MNHFQYSQQIRKEIESNKQLYELLRKHFLGEQPLTEKLGEGDSFKHYAAPNLPSGLGIATKEPKENPYDKQPLEDHCETTYTFASFLHPEGHKSVNDVIENPANYSNGSAVYSAFCIGVKYKPKSSDKYQYALLVENLRSAKEVRLTSRTADSGYIVCKDKEITVWFDTGAFKDAPGALASLQKSRGMDKIPKYMEEQNLIVFE
jgi:hypothetical protein